MRAEVAARIQMFGDRFVDLAGVCVASVKAMRKAVDLAELKEEKEREKRKQPSVCEVQCARIQHACIATKIDFSVHKPILVQLSRLKNALREARNIPMDDRDAVDELAFETDAYVSVAYREVHGHLVAVSKVVREALETWKRSFTVANIFSTHACFDRRAAFEQARIKHNYPLLSCLHDLVARTGASTLSDLMPLPRMAQLTGTLATMAELGDLSTAREESKIEWNQWLEDGATIVDHRVISDIMDTAIKHREADNSAMRVGIASADVVRAAAFWATLLTGRPISSEACGPAKIQITVDEFKKVADGVTTLMENRLDNLFRAAKQRAKMSVVIAERLHAEEASLQQAMDEWKVACRAYLNSAITDAHLPEEMKQQLAVLQNLAVRRRPAVAAVLDGTMAAERDIDRSDGELRDKLAALFDVHTYKVMDRSIMVGMYMLAQKYATNREQTAQFSPKERGLLDILVQAGDVLTAEERASCRQLLQKVKNSPAENAIKSMSATFEGLLAEALAARQAPVSLQRIIRLCDAQLDLLPRVPLSLKDIDLRAKELARTLTGEARTHQLDAEELSGLARDVEFIAGSQTFIKVEPLPATARWLSDMSLYLLGFIGQFRGSAADTRNLYANGRFLAAAVAAIQQCS